MKVSFKEELGRTEPEIIIVAGEKTPELEELISRLTGLSAGPITAFSDDRAVFIPPEKALRFFTDGKGVSLQTAEGVFSVRQRLYELENSLDGHTFVRVSNSEIVNLRHITAIDLDLTGTIRLTLTGGVTVWGSRRYIKKIKTAVGL